jgi:integrase/recombinase XerD
MLKYKPKMLSEIRASIVPFLDYLTEEKKYSQNTLLAYTSDLNQLIDYIESAVPEEEQTGLRLDAKLLSGYLDSLKGKGYKPSSVARKVAAAKSFIAFLLEKGKLQDDLTPILTSPKVRKPIPKPLSVSDIRNLLAEPAKLSTPEAKRDKAMLELLYATGLRASELMALNVKDINLKKNTVKCVSRGSRTRVIPIDDKVAQVIKEYRDNARLQLTKDEKETALFVNRRGERLTRQGFWQIVQYYANKAGLDIKVTPRNIRHSFAVQKLKGGADLQSVKELLGHAHVSTTKAYTQIEHTAD